LRLKLNLFIIFKSGDLFFNQGINLIPAAFAIILDEPVEPWGHFLAPQTKVMRQLTMRSQEEGALFTRTSIHGQTSIIDDSYLTKINIIILAVFLYFVFAHRQYNPVKVFKILSQVEYELFAERDEEPVGLYVGLHGLLVILIFYFLYLFGLFTSSSFSSSSFNLLFFLLWLKPVHIELINKITGTLEL
jgi:hypothetical protein